MSVPILLRPKVLIGTLVAVKGAETAVTGLNPAQSVFHYTPNQSAKPGATPPR